MVVQNFEKLRDIGQRLAAVHESYAQLVREANCNHGVEMRARIERIDRELGALATALQEMYLVIHEQRRKHAAA